MLPEVKFFDSDWPFGSGAGHPSNHQMLADRNRRNVLGLIARRKCLSQKDLSLHTRLQASTVSNIIRLLKDMELVRDGSAISAERVGPKETALEIAPSYAWSVGLSLDQHCRLIAINAAGHILEQFDLPSDLSLSKVLETIPELLSEIKTRQHLAGDNFVGVGVSVAGVVDSSNGVVLLSRVLRERLFPLRSTMEKALQVPVWVERNVICGAYAEHFAGVARSQDSFLYFSIIKHADQTCGFGLATVVEERIIRGSHSAAGEIDFLLARMSCPAHLGDDFILSDDFCRPCGEAVSIIVNLLDIDCVVISSNEARLTEERQKTLEQSMAVALVQVPGRSINVKRSTLQVAGPLLGSALLILHRKMAAALLGKDQPPNKKRVKNHFDPDDPRRLPARSGHQ